MPPFIVGHLVVAGLDIGRFHWSDVPAAVQGGGFLGLAVCFSFFFSAVRANRFYSPFVRIQTERGHREQKGAEKVAGRFS